MRLEVREARSATSPRDREAIARLQRVVESRETFHEEALEKNLGGDGRVAALSYELDGAMEVGVALGQPLRKVNGVARLNELVETPAGDLVAVALLVLDDLGHLYAFDRL